MVLIQIWIESKAKIKNDVIMGNNMATGRTDYLFEEIECLADGSRRGYIYKKGSSDRLVYDYSDTQPWIREPNTWLALFSPESRESRIWRIYTEKDEKGDVLLYLSELPAEELKKEK